MLTRNFERLKSEVADHVKADRVVQGSYETCFIGCLANGHDDTEFIQNQYGIPFMVTRIAESIFEGLPADEAIRFFAAIPQAIGSNNKDLTFVGWKFLAEELRALPPVSDDTQAVINSVIEGMDLLAEGKEWTDAARAASDVSAAVTRAAVVDATYVTYAATRAATYAATATYATAVTAVTAAAVVDATYDAVVAARLRQRDTLLRLISEAPITQEDS